MVLDGHDVLVLLVAADPLRGVGGTKGIDVPGPVVLSSSLKIPVRPVVLGVHHDADELAPLPASQWAAAGGSRSCARTGGDDERIVAVVSLGIWLRHVQLQLLARDWLAVRARRQVHLRPVLAPAGPRRV